LYLRGLNEFGLKAASLLSFGAKASKRETSESIGHGLCFLGSVISFTNTLFLRISFIAKTRIGRSKISTFKAAPYTVLSLFSSSEVNSEDVLELKTISGVEVAFTTCELLFRETNVINIIRIFNFILTGFLTI
tara:strand:- start:10012 stop:10410 length:399 start_codon:yes stop_codon:yes gene_type:complete